MTEYTVILPERDVLALIRGEVTHDVLVLAISCIRAMYEPPEYTLVAVQDRARRRTQEANKP